MLLLTVEEMVVVADDMMGFIDSVIVGGVSIERCVYPGPEATLQDFIKDIEKFLRLTEKNFDDDDEIRMVRERQNVLTKIRISLMIVLDEPLSVGLADHEPTQPVRFGTDDFIICAGGGDVQRVEGEYEGSNKRSEEGG